MKKENDYKDEPFKVALFFFLILASIMIVLMLAKMMLFM